MARRSRRTGVRGKPNYLWINTAGDLALIEANTVWDAILQPGDWSGTVTDQSCTLLRMVLSVYTLTSLSADEPHAENACILIAHSAEVATSSPLDISNYAEWPDFFAEYDRVLRIFRLEWEGALKAAVVGLPVQFSQLPEPVMNMKTPRRLTGQDSIRLCVGGAWAQATNEAPGVIWFARSLVRIGLK